MMDLMKIMNCVVSGEIFLISDILNISLDDCSKVFNRPFSCDKTKCIKARLVCDKRKTCDDGTDEDISSCCMKL